jgi:hypothetical protein
MIIRANPRYRGQRRFALEQLETRIAFNVQSVMDASSALPVTSGCHGPFCPCAACHGGSSLETADHAHSHDLYFDQDGNAYYFDPLPADLPEDDGGDILVSGPDGNGDGEVQAAFTLDEIPALHSNPASTLKIYLDFNGHTVTGTSWNGNNNGNPIHAPAYDSNGDIFSFSQMELDEIYAIWERVSEDFAPFDVDVTTEDPGVAKFTAGNQGVRLLVSTSTDDSRLGGTGHQWFSPSGGVAYVGSWSWNTDTPAWVFYNHLGGGVKKISEAASHEVGHTLGLNHDGQQGGIEYYEGHGTGATGWAPIMGTGYYKPVTQWSRNEYQNANNTGQDDLVIISRKLPYRADDHSNTIGPASSTLVADGDSLAGSGIITTRTDIDYFQFEITAFSATVQIDVSPWHNSPNLDVVATLYSTTGSLVETSNPADSLAASFTHSLSPGTYYLAVDGVGFGNPLNNGFSDYASLGSYTVSITLDRHIGDVNFDGFIDDLDIDDLFDAVHTGDSSPTFDLNEDGTVNNADVDFLVYDILQTSYGDANLDGQVDGTDFTIWNDNQFRVRSGWYFADFDGSTTTDVSDFNIWLINRFAAPATAAAASTPKRSTPRAPASAASETPVVVAPVPTSIGNQSISRQHLDDDSRRTPRRSIDSTVQHERLAALQLDTNPSRPNVPLRRQSLSRLAASLDRREPNATEWAARVDLFFS